jgi:predicted metalloprotease with PDZ domain
MTSAQQPSIHYILGMSKPSTHLLEVEIVYDYLSSEEKSLDLQLPVWRPGRYVVLDFASGVVAFSALDVKGNPLRWSKADKSLWRVETAGSSKVTVRYRVFANEFNLRTRGLNDEHAFVDGAAVFMYIEKYRRAPVQLTVLPYGNWHVTTGLEGDGKKFTASSYDHLVDCPLEIGTHNDFRFTVDAIPHVLSIFGEGNWTSDTLIRDITRIIKSEKELWGEFPYKRYVFLVHCTPSSGGGTEHLNSTIMGVRPFAFKNHDAYRNFLGLVSHEYFHTWNVKQLRPKGLHPYDYTKENYSRELWVAEGTTSYYGDLLLVRSGFMPADKYLENLAQAIRGDRQRPGNAVQSISESSFDAWVKFWRGTEQSFNAESDYYGKGATVSMILDLEIRNRSANAHSLDDVLREMYRRFPLSGPGYTLNDFQRVAEEISGENLKTFFDDYVYGTKPLPWEDHLAYAGLQLVPKDSSAAPWIGITTQDAGEKTKVTRVSAGSPAYQAGLDINDEILALNGYRVRTSDITDRIAEFKAGDSITLTVFRNDRLREFKVTVVNSLVPAYKIARTPNPTDHQQQIYQSWLRSPADTSATTGHPK